MLCINPKLNLSTIFFIVDVPMPVIIWDPMYLNWDDINSNLVDSFQLSATNKGLIATDNLTFSVPSYWRNTAFIAPKERNLGRLSANSTLSFPVKLEQIIRYDVPSNRFELRGEDPNTVVFLPDLNDTEWWESGPDYIMIDGDDVTNQWYYKFDSEGIMIFSYCYNNRTRYDYVYNGTVVNGTEIAVDVIVTPDINLTTSRMLSNEMPPPIQPLRDIIDAKDESGRNLLSINNPEDCLLAVACILCELFVEEFKKKRTDSSPKENSPKEDSTRRELWVTVAARAIATAIKICDTIDKYTSIAKYGFKVGIPLPGPVSDICNALNPCKWFCPKPTNIGGSTVVRIVCGIHCFLEIHH